MSVFDEKLFQSDCVSHVVEAVGERVSVVSVPDETYGIYSDSARGLIILVLSLGMFAKQDGPQ